MSANRQLVRPYWPEECLRAAHIEGHIVATNPLNDRRNHYRVVGQMVGAKHHLRREFRNRFFRSPEHHALGSFDVGLYEIDLLELNDWSAPDRSAHRRCRRPIFGASAPKSALEKWRDAAYFGRAADRQIEGGALWEK